LPTCISSRRGGRRTNHQTRGCLRLAGRDFCPGFIAKGEGLLARYGLDVELVLMQRASAYMPALANGNIEVLYGGGTAVSRDCYRRLRPRRDRDGNGNRLRALRLMSACWNMEAVFDKLRRSRDRVKSQTCFIATGLRRHRSRVRNPRIFGQRAAP